ncbi:hypothetical protein Ae201684_001018 [Aphanomyces euteiches]|uniref:PWWP domain-containing protein n=1 Tax=Aphanomyces euteiches TaxID=100861 RepID=A0A6G0XVF9_9STRA|nr:hypothetical protein Ae201684_001018 [Aphanomyces euteiches]
MRPDHLHYLGKSHTNALERAYSNVKYALVYYLGLYVFGAVEADTLEPWLFPDQNTYSNPTCTSDEIRKVFDKAIDDAQSFLATGMLPHLLPSDLDKILEPPPKSLETPVGSLIWLLAEPHGWLPGYIFEPTHLQTKRGVTNKHLKSMLKQVKGKPEKYYVIYTFAIHRLTIYNRAKARTEPWECPEHELFVHGFPPERKNPLLPTALKEVQAFIKAKHNQKTLTLEQDFRIKLSWKRNSLSSATPSEVDPETEEESEGYSSDEIASAETSGMNKPDGNGKDRLKETKLTMGVTSTGSLNQPTDHDVIVIDDSSDEEYGETQVKIATVDVNVKVKGDTNTSSIKLESNQSSHEGQPKKRKTICPPCGLELREERKKKTNKEQYEESLEPKVNMFPNGVAWGNMKGSIWWPVYICNRTKWWRATVQQDDKTRTFGIYCFGSHKMKRRQFSMASLKPWRSPDAKQIFEGTLEAIGHKSFDKVSMFEDAQEEAENFFSEFNQIQDYLGLDDELRKLNDD